MAAADDFNAVLFEKKLQNLKDTQESINSCCNWCLDNRKHHKKIVNAWLNVLKHVKVEQRLTLFYLANDVIQYSKRKGYEFVESWGTSLQKATPLVRDEKVKHKILRIFTIWQQRGVYGDEFLSDLSGLISASPPIRKNDDPHEFESQYLITKIRNCSKLEKETDAKLKKFKEHNPKILVEGESGNLFGSLKDRAHVDDVEKEMNDYIKHMEGYINCLKGEIKARSHLIGLLVQADNQLDKDKKDVKLVANAYKAFSTRIKNLKKKLEELKPKLESPLPSPDINAPSPSPDEEDSEEDDEERSHNCSSNNKDKKRPYSPDFSSFANPGFYNPVAVSQQQYDENHQRRQSQQQQQSQQNNNNGFSSFMGGNAPPFNLANLFSSTTSNSSTNNAVGVGVGAAPPLPSLLSSSNDPYQQYSSSGPQPQGGALIPPPIPPFNVTKEQGSYYDNSSYNQQQQQAYDPNNSYNANQSYAEYQAHFAGYGSSAGAGNEEYNPEDGGNWANASLLDTPASPIGVFDRTGNLGGTDYNINLNMKGDRDLRTLPIVVPLLSEDKKLNNLSGRGKKDVDHRNLISLTGSPQETMTNNSSGSGKNNKQQQDQDYRMSDKDYRIPPFNIASLKLPPPPPPPSSALSSSGEVNSSTTTTTKTQSPRKQLHDKVEIIDMELSDDESTCNLNVNVNENMNLRQVPLTRLSPPPLPLNLPSLPDLNLNLNEDVEANLFLDDLNADLNSWNSQQQQQQQIHQINSSSASPVEVVQGFRGGGGGGQRQYSSHHQHPHPHSQHPNNGRGRGSRGGNLRQFNRRGNRGGGGGSNWNNNNGRGRPPYFNNRGGGGGGGSNRF